MGDEDGRDGEKVKEKTTKRRPWRRDDGEDDGEEAREREISGDVGESGDRTEINLKVLKVPNCTSLLTVNPKRTRGRRSASERGV